MKILTTAPECWKLSPLNNLAEKAVLRIFQNLTTTSCS